MALCQKDCIDPKAEKKLWIIAGLGGVSFFVAYLSAVLYFQDLKNRPTYEYDIDSRTNKFTDEISIDQLEDESLITVKDLNGDDKYYIGETNLFKSKVTDYLTGNQFSTSQPLFNWDTHLDVSNKEDIVKYLVTLDELQEYYTYDELVDILNEISEYKEEEKVKTLTR